MTTSVPLYQPLNTLKLVADDIWIADGDVTWMNMGILRAPFSTRMTVIRLQDGGLWCHSPIAPDPALLAAIDALGPVRHLVSPNYIHYAHIPAWQARYPQAVAWASPGVRERAAKNRIAVRFDADLDDAAPPDWAGQIAQTLFRGSRIMREIDFFHHASRTLILTDLLEADDETGGQQRPGRQSADRYARHFYRPRRRARQSATAARLATGAHHSRAWPLVCGKR